MYCFLRAQSTLTTILLAPMLLLLLCLLGYFLHLPSPVSAQQNSSSSNAVNANLLTRQRFAELIRFFTAKNWMFDYGGGMAIRVVQPNAAGRELVYVTANKYVKSHYDPEDVFVFDFNSVMNASLLASKTLPAPLSSSRTGELATAAINQLRYAINERRKNASFSANDIVAVMHSHSKYSDILSGMLREGDVIRITGEQMINAIEDRSTGLVLAYTDTLEIPIIRNDPSEGLFIEPMMAMLKKFPRASGIIMQKHGIFVWGQNSWERTKQMFESYEYLMEGELQRIQLRAMGLLLPRLKGNASGCN